MIEKSTVKVMANHIKGQFDVDMGLDGRDKEELCKFILKLYYTLCLLKEIQNEVETTFQHSQY